jgi:hypothetical protein
MPNHIKVSGPDTEVRRFYQEAVNDGPPPNITIDAPANTTYSLMSRRRMGQMEWSDIIISLGLNGLSSVCYDWLKTVMIKSRTTKTLTVSEASDRPEEETVKPEEKGKQ